MKKKSTIITTTMLLLCTTALYAETRESFNRDWKFNVTYVTSKEDVRNEPKNVKVAEFDDSSWRTLDLPHDWGIEGPFDMKLQGATGKLPWAGIGWYRKIFDIPSSDKGKRVFLDIDGAMADSTIYLNGKEIGGRPYGYISFRTELTDALNFGGSNTLAVRLDTSRMGTRWYPGAGLYRNVWLIKTSPVHIGQWGVHVQTPELSDAQGTAAFEITIRNQSGKAVDAIVQTAVYEYGTNAALGQEVAKAQPVNLKLAANADSVASLQTLVVNPKRWDINDPQRYLSRTKVHVNGKLVDSYDQPFGFRTLEFTAHDGFRLNGRRIPIQGVCMHHDLGPLGGAFNTRAFERQMEIMLEMGVNAIRTSHNQPAPEVLEVCDRLGILVQVESFDCWAMGKKAGDYRVFFQEWHERDLSTIVRMGRNNPSVFMWCVGNEIMEKKTEEGIQIVEALNAIVKRYDTSRPTTIGMNSTIPAFSGFQKHLDVFGFNYQLQGYEQFQKHEDNEERPYHGSETSSCISSRGEYFFPVFNDFKARRSAGTPATKKSASATPKPDNGTGGNFQMSSYDVSAPGWGCTPDYQFMTLEKNPSALGEFVWTGFDYIGEPTPYNRDITNLLNFSDPEKIAKMKKELDAIGKVTPPSRSSYFGIVDLCGFKKDRFYLYQSQWKPELPMAHILPHWNWPDRVGEVTPVHVYTSGDEAELFLNGESLGRKKKEQYEYRLMWNEVTYQPGELKVVAYKDGKEWAADVMKTTGKAAQVELSADRAAIASDGLDLAFVTVAINDEDGLNVPQSDNLVTFDIEGSGKIVAVGNGNAISHESFQATQRKAYNGLCQVIISSKRGEAGPITLTAASKGLSGNTITIHSK